MQFPVLAPTKFKESSVTLWARVNSAGEETDFVIGAKLTISSSFGQMGLYLFFPACYLIIACLPFQS